MNNEFIFDPSALLLIVVVLVSITVLYILPILVDRTEEISKDEYNIVKDMIKKYPQLKSLVSKNKITVRGFKLITKKHNELNKDIKEQKEKEELEKAKSLLYKTINDTED